MVQKRHNLSVTPLKRVILAESPEYAGHIGGIMEKIHYLLTEDNKPHDFTTAYTRKRKDGTLEIELHEKIFIRTLSGTDIFGDKEMDKIKIVTGENGEPKVFKKDEDYESLEIVVS